MMQVPLTSNITIRARLIQSIAALERVGLTPVSNRDLHALAYVSNVLSPLWDVDPIETSVLKDKNGPRSSALEHEIDLCVGNGALAVVSLRADLDDPSRLNATYRLNAKVAQPVLQVLAGLPDEKLTADYLNELAFAYSEVKQDNRDGLAQKDAAWSNPAIVAGRVIDFGARLEEAAINPTLNAAQAFQRFAPEGVLLDRAEKLLMYVRLLKRRAHG